MKANAGFDAGGRREPDGLRRLLRRFQVPVPPPEIEAELVSTFRRRRARARPVLWLAAAACAALLVFALWPLHPELPPRPANPRALATPSAPPAPAAVRGAIPSPMPAAVSQRRTTRRPAPATSGDPVVVEPRQAELLAQLARDWTAAQAARPGAWLARTLEVPADVPPAAIPFMNARDGALEYRARWETVGSEWPPTQASAVDKLGGMKP